MLTPDIPLILTRHKTVSTLLYSLYYYMTRIYLHNLLSVVYSTYPLIDATLTLSPKSILWHFTNLKCYARMNLIYDFKILLYESVGICKMNKKLKTESVDYLFDAVLSLQNKEECYNFFEDLCTVNELLSLSQRFEVASMLRAKKTYLEIAEKTGASTATISRVNRSLNYGTDGYELIFERIDAKTSNKNENI